MEIHWKLTGIQRKTWSESEIMFTIYSKGVAAKQVATTSAGPVSKLEGTVVRDAHAVIARIPSI